MEEQVSVFLPCLRVDKLMWMRYETQCGVLLQKNNQLLGGVMQPGDTTAKFPNNITSKSALLSSGTFHP